MKQISNAGLDLIKSFEGCRLTAYKPVATEQYWTIGWGHYGPDVSQGMTITQAQADAMLIEDMARYVSYVNQLSIVDQLNQNQFDALVSFCYNCGPGNLRNLCLGRTIEGIAENLPKYNKGGGVVLKGLVRRRAAELELFNKEDEEEMELKAQVAQLQSQVDTLLQTAEAHVKRINELERLNNVSVPEFAKEANQIIIDKKATSNPNEGSYDFFRIITILHRLGIIK